MVHSTLSWSRRITIVVVGGLLLLGGSFARAIEDTYGGTTESEHVVVGDGTLEIYDILDEGAHRYEIEEVDDSTSVVFEILDTGDRLEAFRGSPDAAEAFELEAESQSRVLAYSGPRDEALAWDEARAAEDKNYLIPNLVIGAGILLIVAGILLGWRRKQEVA